MQELTVPSILEFACNALTTNAQSLLAGDESASRRTAQALWWVTRIAGTATEHDVNWSVFLLPRANQIRASDVVISTTERIIDFVLKTPHCTDRPELFSALIAAVLVLGMIGHAPLGRVALQALPVDRRCKMFNLICSCTKENHPVSHHHPTQIVAFLTLPSILFYSLQALEYCVAMMIAGWVGEMGGSHQS